MNHARIIEIKNLQLARVNFYTIWIEDCPDSEFYDFTKRLSLNQKDKNELRELLIFLKEIGNEHGALSRYFHHEAAAHALAVPYLRHIDIDIENNDFGLRLYCLRLSESIVILFNGDRKTTQTAQDCPNCAKYFRLAQRITSIIDSEIREKNIIPIWKKLLFDNDFDLMF